MSSAAVTERQILTKPTLAALSHSIERVAETMGSGTTLIALFQRGAYFSPMVPRFERLVASQVQVITAYAGPGPRCDGAHHVELEEDDQLVGEWSVVLVSPSVGAFLVADDLLELEAAPVDLESGRRFSAMWGFDRLGAVGQARRLITDIEDRLPRDVRDAAWQATDLARRHEVTPVEQALVTTAEVLAAGVESAALALRTQRAELHAEIDRASRDQLTGLVNRAGLDRWLGGRRADGLPLPRLGVVIIDLDGFKLVNDTYGHLVGDELLQGVAEALLQATRPEDVVIRWGGDEFVVLCPGVAGTHLGEVASRLVEAAAGVRVGDASVSASAGVQECTHRPLELAVADAALYEAKRSGGDQVAVGF